MSFISFLEGFAVFNWILDLFSPTSKKEPESKINPTDAALYAAVRKTQTRHAQHTRPDPGDYADYTIDELEDRLDELEDELDDLDISDYRYSMIDDEAEMIREQLDFMEEMDYHEDW